MALATLAVLSPAAAAQQAATLGGTLLDRSTQRPVEGARVAVLGTALVTSTDVEGRFEMPGVPAGVRVLQARAIGYSVSSWMVQLSEGQVMRQTLELEPRALQLDTITIAAVENTGWRSEAAFELRRAKGSGVFIGRQEIQRRHAQTLSDLLRSVPGLMTTCNNQVCMVRMYRESRPCLPEYYLDGHPATFSTGPSFPMAQIRGIEVYRDRFETPAEFQSRNLSCGVIAIWTVDPGTPLERR